MAGYSTLLRDRVTLSVRAVDRIFLQGYVPHLQTPGWCARFLREQRAFGYPSSKAFGEVGKAYEAAIRAFAKKNAIPVIRFAKGDNKEEIARPYLEAAAADGRGKVALIGVGQEKASTWRSWQGRRRDYSGRPLQEWGRQMAFVNHFYFYLWDAEWGPYADRPVMPHRVPLCWSQRLPGVQCGISSRRRVRVTGRRGRPGGCRAACIVLQGRFRVPAVRAPVP
jgi:hypothetical protein